MKNLEIKELRLVDLAKVGALKEVYSTNNPVHHFWHLEKFATHIDPSSADFLFSLIIDGQWIGWIGLFPVLDPFGRLGISEIQFDCKPDKSERNCILLAIQFLLVKARSQGNWSCLIHLQPDSELIPFLFDSGFILLGQKNSGIESSTDIELLILEKRLH